jgi:glycosyltransferase involved in cell wall biosynthesis
LGYAGVIDERIDMALVRELATLKPDWQFVMIGPVVKIDSSQLPRCPNIHWLGMKSYRDLPTYFAGWDIALMPFALNDATRFISPTKTPEYLAAGLPVVSTPIQDVVRQYGEHGLVRIANDATAFAAASQCILEQGVNPHLQYRIDSYLATLSWEMTWKAMDRLIREAMASRQPLLSQIPFVSRVEPAYV